MALLDIHVLGSPILRQVTEPVTTFGPELERLVDDMFETMYAAKGIGLAAPQVGRRERVAVVDVDGARYALVNPEVSSGDGSIKGEEGCLSIPEIFGDVERKGRVVVRAVDERNRPVEIDATELLGRCLQHEIDHLHGRLFIDYLSVLKRRAALAKWAKLRTDFPGLLRKVTPEDAALHTHEGDL